MIVQHLLALYPMVIGPLWDHFEIRRLKIGTDPRRKLKFYLLTIAVTWALSAAACAAVGWQGIFEIHVGLGETSWMPSGDAEAAFMLGLGTFLIALWIPAILVRKSARYAATIEKAMKPLRFILPATGEERWWWVAICATAGIGEEILYRGFLIQYFRHAPLHLNLIPALMLACAVFGFAHIYQGLKGIVGTGILGLLLSAVFVITGNLLVPVILHFLIDLRILLLLPAENKLNLESA